MKKHIGLTFDWDYKGRKVHLSIPGYVETSMKYFQQKVPIKPEDKLYQHIPPTDGAWQQYTEPEDEAPELNISKKRVSSK